MSGLLMAVSRFRRIRLKWTASASPDVLDVERAGKRVAALGAVDALGVGPAGVHRPSLYVSPGLICSTGSILPEKKC